MRHLFFHGKHLWWGLVVFFSVIVGQQANAMADSAMRCQGRLVFLGDDATQVEKTCGPPDQITTWEEGPRGYMSEYYDYRHERYKAPRLLKSPVQMERWTYRFGSNQFTRYLYFRDDQLIRIETGEKSGD
jgi:Protein of unknown function (DUF2845)